MLTSTPPSAASARFLNMDKPWRQVADAVLAKRREENNMLKEEN